jgi:hypothetical protein
LSYLITTASWHRLSAISQWPLALFLGELRRLFFTYRPSELQLNRRQRMRKMLRLSRLTDEHSVEDFRDPSNPAHRELITILKRLTRQTESVAAS